MSKSDETGIRHAFPRALEPANHNRVLFQLTGSIACYKACQVISRLVQKGVEVQTVASPAALEFVGQATLEGLTGKPVFTNIVEPGRVMDHIALARWADIAVLCPATAHTLNGLAAGVAADPLGCLFLAWDFRKKPYLVAPAMNHMMLAHPATRQAFARLKEWGVELLPTEVGHQACGEEGDGRMLDPDRVSDNVLQRLKERAGVL